MLPFWFGWAEVDFDSFCVCERERETIKKKILERFDTSCRKMATTTFQFLFMIENKFINF